MAGIFFTTPLSRTASNGVTFDHVDAYFDETQVFATVTLSAYMHESPERYMAFQSNRAEAYIVTPETPVLEGSPTTPARRDNTVFLTTNRLSFWLHVFGRNTAPTTAAAVGVIYDYAPAATFDFTKVIRRLDLAVFDDEGTVIGTHASVRLQGGPDFDEEETRDRALADAYEWAGREPGSLRVAPFERDRIPSGADLCVDPSTGRVDLLGGPIANPFRA